MLLWISCDINFLIDVIEITKSKIKHIAGNIENIHPCGVHITLDGVLDMSSATYDPPRCGPRF